MPSTAYLDWVSELGLSVLSELGKVMYLLEK
jgi:hypothetical protein